MKTARLVPQGAVEVEGQETWKLAKARIAVEELTGDTRRKYVRYVSKRIKTDFSHLIEAYGLLFGPNTEPVIVFNRQYNPIARLSWEAATELMESAVVTNTWAGYTLGTLQGDAVWIAHPESSEGKKAVAAEEAS